MNELEGAFLRNLIQPERPKPRSRTKVGHYISVAEAAKRLGVSTKTVTRWCESGTLAAIEKPYGNKTTYEIQLKSVEVLLVQQEESKQQAERAERDCKPHSAYVDAWKRAMEKGILTGKPYSKETIDDYIQHVNTYFKRNTSVSIDGLKAGLAKIPVDSVAKRQHFYKAVRCFGKYLIAEGALKSDFIELIKPLSPKYHKPPKRHSVTVESLEAILGSCESALDTTLVLMLSNTGLRASELCALKASDVDLTEGTLIVRCGKGGKSRKLGLNTAAIECLRKYLAACPTEGYLFRDTKGKQMHRHGLYQRLERIGKLAGVKVSPHSLRRAFVTHNANLGRPLQMLQMACGHSDIKTTMSYCRTSERDLIDAMKDW